MAKALLRYIDAERGSAAGDAWLKRLNMVRDDLSDETRPMPLSALHDALVGFAGLVSRDAIADAWKYLVSRDVLGAWVRVLRGTTSPVEAFARLDSSESEYGRTTRWETTASGADFWKGRVHIVHDPALETDGLLALARIAELSAVPALFGYGRAVYVTCKPVTSRGASYQEFEVRWRVPNMAQSGAVGAATGGLVASVPLALDLAMSGIGIGTVALGALAGAVIGGAWARDRARRAETASQSMRVHALERSISLKEEREKAQAGNLEGSVVAGQYRIRQRMGSGASGVIYEAERIADGMPVAIKLLRAAAAHDAVASDRLRREAEALGLSWHPNVVEVIDHGLLPDGTSYLVMELLHGESLHARLKTKGRLTPVEVLPVAMQVCDALVAVHAAGVVHRDLKPSNIFLAVDRDDPAGPMRVKLLDFGIARVEWEETRITNMGAPLGTVGYMSPEQETGGEVDARSDIFALGAVLYECLVGEPPPPLAPSGVTRTSPGAPIQSFLSRFDWNSKKVSNLVPPAWRAVIEHAMAPLPDERFQDARAFAAALRGLREEIARAEVGP
jgi:serine/threonine-protein kinase